MGLSIRPSQPQREENPFSGFLLHLAPCLASSRSSTLGVWGHQPNKPLWIQKGCQCRQEWASRGLWGRQAASPKCDTGGSSGTSPFRTSKARLRHGSGTQVEPLLQVTGLAASLTSQHMGGEWTKCLFPVPPCISPHAWLQSASSYITAGTMTFTIPIQVSHRAHARKKECLTLEKDGAFSSELRAADLSVLLWDLLALPLSLSIMEQISHGSYTRTLRRNSSSCFFILCRVPKRPSQLPDPRGWASTSWGCSGPYPRCSKPGKPARRSGHLCGPPLTSIHRPLRTLNTKAAASSRFGGSIVTDAGETDLWERIRGLRRSTEPSKKDPQKVQEDWKQLTNMNLESPQLVLSIVPRLGARGWWEGYRKIKSGLPHGESLKL